MMSALLMGVNRAYPYAKSELDKISEHIDTMYKVVHVATFNVAIHALNLLYQISDYNNSVKDRYDLSYQNQYFCINGVFVDFIQHFIKNYSTRKLRAQSIKRYF